MGTGNTFVSLQVTFGMMTGKAFGICGQITTKPGIQFGSDSPADRSLQVDWKVSNF